jgi:glycosyltransferase involved in cell wall biosynthesis
MPKGRYPAEYFQSPQITKPLEDIYEIIDAYTGEFFEDEPVLHQHIDFMVPLPPLSYDGAFVKGLFLSQATDLLLDRFPALRELFVSAAFSMWSSHPWSNDADAYLVCYKNSARTEWFRRHHPNKAHIAHVPLQDADFTNEYRMGPVRGAERDIDLLCVSRLHSLKNVPLIAHALAIYRKKYPLENIRMTLIAGKQGAYSPDLMSKIEQEQYAKIAEILGRPEDYINFVEHALHFAELPGFYSRARAYVLGSLIEGKNRCLNEAQSCNTPVICFEELNQYARGDTPSFAPGAGLTCSYDAEALADAIHIVLGNPDGFRPRASYLAHYGRKNFLACCLATIPYYSSTIPDFEPARSWDNLWLDLAMQDNYGMSLHEFVYGHGIGVNHAKGLQQIEALTTYYVEKFSM